MLRLYTRVFVVSILLSISHFIFAQDIHFTNFRMVPVQFNPAATGSFKGTYRLSGIFRGQWQTTDGITGYNTPFASAEFNIASEVLMEYDWISGGLSFFQDRSGSANFSYNMTALNVAYHLGLDKKYNDVFTIGASYGNGSQGLNPNQPLRLLGTNGIDPISVTEVSESFNDLRLGVSYKTKLNKYGDLVRVGAAVNNILGSGVTLRTEGVAARDTADVSFGRRLTLTGEGSFLTNDRMRINPGLLFMTKDGITQVMGQGTVEYLVNEESQVVVSAGMGYRLGDALQFLAGVQIKDLQIGISYDATTSAAPVNNAFEVGVTYTGTIYKEPRVKPVIFCPKL